jgi:uncharacterized protein (DUF1800 family)
MILMRLRFRASVVLVVALALAGAAAADTGFTVSNDDRAIVHALNRIGFGPRPGDLERVRAIGLATYIERQLHPDSVGDTAVESRLAQFETLAMRSRELAEKYFLPALMERRERKRDDTSRDEPRTLNPGDGGADQPRPRAAGAAMRQASLVLAELSEQKLLRAISSERQLQEVMVDFWFNHFNVFAGKGASRLYLTEYERDAIRPHALGRFRDLLGAVAKSPAMLFYLDNWMSADPEAGRTLEAARDRLRGRFGGRRQRPGTTGTRPTRPQQRRGLNENYARELMELHTLGVDGGYTQTDVVEVARCFTGWTIAGPRAGGGFHFAPRLHDEAEKVVLGQVIPAGRGRSDGESVLDLLASHPSTARFIATKLARRLVADEPPASIVDRAAARFLATNGDIREVVRTIVFSQEFFAPDAYRAKVKSPFEFVVSAVRATGAQVSSALPLAQSLRALGQPLYFAQPPTGYADRADAWVNTGALLSRMNFAVALVGRTLNGVSLDLSTFGTDDPDAARERIVDGVLAGEASKTTIDTIVKGADVREVMALALGSPEFQRR